LKFFFLSYNNNNKNNKGELTKFRVTPLHVVFHCIQVLLNNFNGFNIDIVCSLLETCGRFLYRIPETKTRLGNMLDIMMRKKTVQHLDNRQVLLIENAYYQCNPPEKIIKPVKERSPIELYIRKMIYVDLGKYTVDRICKQFRKLNWDDPEVLRVIYKVFFKIWKLKYINIHLMSYLVVELSHYHPDFGVAVVDNTIEDIRIGLEVCVIIKYFYLYSMILRIIINQYSINLFIIIIVIHSKIIINIIKED